MLALYFIKVLLWIFLLVLKVQDKANLNANLDGTPLKWNGVILVLLNKASLDCNTREASFPGNPRLAIIGFNQLIKY